MTSKQVVQWGEFHGQDYYEVDGSGNLWEGNVYLVCGELYLVEYCNHRLCEEDKPIKVVAHEVMTYEYEKA